MSYILGMDTIIYFYQKRNLLQREITLMYQENYLLAKVGVCADRYSWAGCPLPEAPVPVGQDEAGSGPGFPALAGQGREGDRSAFSVPVEAQRGGRKKAGGCQGWFARRRQERERRRESKRLQQEYMQKLQEYEAQREELEDSMRQLWREVLREVERVGGMGEAGCVYEESLRFLKGGQGEAARCWGTVWNLPEFAAYRDVRWVQLLLEYARHSDFILLGTAECIPAILRKLARQMRSLQWYVCETDLEEAGDLAEEFCEEYGLAVAVGSLAGRQAFRQLKLKSTMPVCVMDFTDETAVSAGGLAGDSVWLDFASMEEKSVHLSGQNHEIRYISLKRHWGAKIKRQPDFADGRN